MGLVVAVFFCVEGPGYEATVVECGEAVLCCYSYCARGQSACSGCAYCT